MKKETFWKKANRVEKELNAMIKKYGTIPSLTEDQRYLLTTGFGEEEGIYETFRIDGELFMDDVINGTNPINNKKDFIRIINDTLDKCIAFVSKNKLVYVSYGFDDYGGYGKDRLAVSGYKSIPDKDLINTYVNNFIKNQEEKNKKKKQTKVKIIDGKKYKLVEDCACECGCDCSNGHCDYNCGECQ